MTRADKADLDLIRRAQKGQEAALSQLFERYRQDVLRMVYRILGPDADLEDVVQEAFIQVYRSIGSFRGDAQFTTWLYRVVTNVARMHLRARRARPQTLVAVPPETGRETAKADNHPEAQLQHQRDLALLYRHLDTLSEKKRTVLVLHDLSGLTAQQIAEIVGASALTVRTRLFYARKELYRALASDPGVSEEVRASLAGGRR